MACMTPFIVKEKKTKGNGTIPVPCGKCPECLKRRTSGWSFRLMQEEKRAMSASFITLTYGTKHVAITRNGFMDLSRRHIQLFFKRLRKLHERYYESKNIVRSQTPIRYYAVGEYGGRTRRPHYHIILFNAQLNLVSPAWGMGEVHYGTVTGASIGYCLKYMCKPSKIPMHRNDDRQREFALMSKRLGENYITPQKTKWHKKDLINRMYVPIEGGKKIAMPRYYKNKIYHDSQRRAIAYYQQKRIDEELLKKEREGTIQSERDRAESVKGAFRKMHHNATLSRDKI